MDPFTKGHKHVADTSLIVFDRLVVGIGDNPNKRLNALFSLEQRVRMTQACLREYSDRVVVEVFTGAAIDFARRLNATAIVRGLRDETDQAYEASMSHANGLISEIEHGYLIPTFYVPCPPSLTEISSSMVRELIGLKRSMAVLENYVLPEVAIMIQNEVYETPL